MQTAENLVHSITTIDPWLSPYQGAIDHRNWVFKHQLNRILAGGVELSEFALAHEFFGLHFVDGGWVLRERAPNATRIVLIGDFCAWEVRAANEFQRLRDGIWELRLPAERLSHGMHYKMLVFWNEAGRECNGERIPAFCRRVVQDPNTLAFSAQVWAPVESYQWEHAKFRVAPQAPLIYEAHVGMATEEAKVSSYREFAEIVLPRIAKAGYNAIQLMAVQEHPYYGSFGYQVSNFFAPSSRFGTPEDLMALVDAAHGLGIAVIMDIVHSHAVKNEIEGLSKLDGSYSLYFHSGSRGEHPAWNTRLFDYGKMETLHFLLSNCRYWLDHFKFDGFRFDGVTSMIYRDHGLGTSVSSYDHYFCGNVDEDAVAYLALANRLIHTLRPDAITMAEEVSGMPGLAAPQEHQGVGFNYRLAMGVPDYWIKLLKHVQDEDWNVAEIWRELAARRAEERTIGYCESHDQALVGDKTIIFWLADKEMYWHMQVNDQNIVIDRAIALHKMIRLLTLGTAGNGYLNFIGNEFGHPEWVDFPREGNKWSYHYARRLWSLRDDPNLKYKFLAEFDGAMMRLAERYRILDHEWPHKSYEHVADKLLVFERAGLIFIFNLNPTTSFDGRWIPCAPGEYQVALSTDSSQFGGYDRIDSEMSYTSTEQDGGLRIYLPCRTAVVLKLLTKDSLSNRAPG
jgi:1,4-alpha-glucan branching enzyme